MSDDAIFIGSLFNLLKFEHYRQIIKAAHCAESACAISGIALSITCYNLPPLGAMHVLTSN